MSNLGYATMRPVEMPTKRSKRRMPMRTSQRIARSYDRSVKSNVAKVEREFVHNDEATLIIANGVTLHTCNICAKSQTCTREAFAMHMATHKGE
jgi:hypothetical protein